MPAPSPSSWYSIENNAGVVDLFIYAEIGSFAQTAIAMLASLKTYGEKRINLRINSPGGSVIQGNAIYNALLRHKPGVTVQIDGMAASMASYLAMVGKPVRMAENGLFMIHNPSGAAQGGSEQMRTAAQVMDKIKAQLVNAYVAKTGIPAAEIAAMMDAETWFTAEEAKAQGFIDEITDRVTTKNSFDLSSFQNAPRSKPPETIATTSWQHWQARATDFQNQLADARAALATAHGTITALTAAKGRAEGKLERLARNGITAEKDSPETLSRAGGDDLVPLMESYLKAGPLEKNALMERHGKRLDEAAVAYDRALEGW
ncbi:MAG TPA: head maturation protease, ClpP-related [Chthoniobacteraceae bacterium]|nr:head maturation protease, ClpP-related [Chthoniobacteraceae bacterium]